MANFPSLTPSGRKLTLGLIPTTEFTDLSGFAYRFRHRAAAYGLPSAILTLEFTNITETDTLTVVNHYYSEHNRAFALPATVNVTDGTAGPLAGIIDFTPYVVSGTLWSYKNPPEVAIAQLFNTPRYNFTVTLESSPPEVP